MTGYSDFIYYSGTNDPVVNAAITVMIANTQTPAALFTSGIGNVIKPNPVTSDQNGFFSFYVAQGTYDLYFLGVKQYQISVNGTTGIPDPLTVQTLNVSQINPTTGQLLIGTTVNNGADKLQVTGTALISPVALTLPPAVQTSINSYGMKLTGNSPGLSKLLIANFSDSGIAGGLTISRNNATGGYLPIAGNIGVINFAVYNSAGTQATNVAAINVFAEEVQSDASKATSLRFYTTPSGGGAFAERMRITHSGNVLIGTTVDDGVNKLQVNGTIKSTGVQVAGVPSANKNTIDFYEFGTWTPVGVNAAVIAAGFSGNDPIVCNYQRIGKRVTVGISILVTGGGTSGQFELGGLPFPVNSLIAPVVALCVGGNGGSYLWVANSGGATELHISPTNNIFSSLTGIQAEVEQFFFGTITYLTD